MCVLIYSFQMLIMKYIYVTCLEFNQILYREHQNKKYIKDKLASIHWIVFSNQMGENIFDPIISGLGSKGGVSSPFFPKIQALPGWGGEVWPMPGFFWRICPHALRALKGDTDTFSDTKFFWNRYRYFFRYQKFSKPIPILFPIPNFFETDTDTFIDTKIFRNRYRKTGKGFETESETF